MAGGLDDFPSGIDTEYMACYARLKAMEMRREKADDSPQDRSSMNDLEMTKLCAEAMGYTITRLNAPLGPLNIREQWASYEPLRDSVQAMALVKQFYLVIGNARKTWCVNTNDMEHTALSTDLNRAIVECVAKMRATGLT